MIKAHLIPNNTSRSKTPFTLKNNYSTINNFSQSLQSTFSLLDKNKSTSLKSYFKEFYLNQVNIKLDERVYDLISKMDDAKAYNEAKKQYDEAKKLLIKEIMKEKYNDDLKLKNANHLNIKNYIDKINEKYSFDEKDNQLMLSLFDKLKTRKKKVYKFKIKNHLEKLFQGNVALYKKRRENFFEEKKKPEKKFDLKLLIKSNADIEEYLKKHKKKKVMFEQNNNNKNEQKNNDEDESNIIKRVEKKKKTYLDKKSNIKDYLNLNMINDRRKSFMGTFNGFKNNSSIHSNNKENKDSKEESSSLNLPNINNDNDQISNSKSISKKSINKVKKSNKSVKGNNNNNIKDKKDSNKSIISKKENIDNINDIKDNDNPLAQFSSKKTLNIKEDRKYHTMKNYFLRDHYPSSNSTKNIKQNDISNKLDNKNYNKLYIKQKKINSRNNLIYGKYQKKSFINDIASEILSELNDKEKQLSMSTLKISKSLKYFKRTKENFNSIKNNRSGNFNYLNNKLINTNTMISPTKKVGLKFQELNENSSQFHFPIINKLFYKDKKGKCDMIDRIKYYLKQEYYEKLKEKKNNRKKKEINGVEIIHKLNDQFELEKLLEMIEMIKANRRKEQNYEIID